MSERFTQLHQLADGRLSELVDLLSTRDEAALKLPVPDREKLGDGTVAACESHTAEHYQRIGATNFDSCIRTLLEREARPERASVQRAP